MPDEHRAGMGGVGRVRPPVERLDAAVVQVVDDDSLTANTHQIQTDVTANEASSPIDQ
jgi:hypothetical protein